jgi:monofunctional biosynthetic peptidoglycan transglycosylase
LFAESRRVVTEVAETGETGVNSPNGQSNVTDLDELMDGISPRKPYRIKTRWLVSAAIVLFILWFVPWVPRLLAGSVTVKQWTKKKGLVYSVVGPGESTWVEKKAVSRHFFHAVVAAEDGRYYQHNGLDFLEIEKSIELNRKKKKYVRGASTITQQVVKMAFLSREKTIIRKLREATGALLLEGIMNKEDILTWYVNLTEFGDGIYGVKAAAEKYFGTKPSLLTIEQAIHLALVIPSPNSWSAGLRRRSLTPFGERRFAKIALNMRRHGYITQQQWLHALATGNFGGPLAAYQQYVADAMKDQCLKGDAKACQEESGFREDEDGDGMSELTTVEEVPESPEPEPAQ